MNPKQCVKERIKRHTVVNAETGCWEWTAGRVPSGYGRMKIGEKNLPAHRVSYEAYIGQIPEGLMILHSCDVRQCVNPDHLRPGSHKDNMKDKTLRGRSRGGRQFWLTAEKISELYRLHEAGLPMMTIAKKLGVDARTVKCRVRKIR